MIDPEDDVPDEEFDDDDFIEDDDAYYASIEEDETDFSGEDCDCDVCLGINDDSPEDWEDDEDTL